MQTTLETYTGPLPGRYQCNGMVGDLPVTALVAARLEPGCRVLITDPALEAMPADELLELMIAGEKMQLILGVQDTDGGQAVWPKSAPLKAGGDQ